ncbi:2-oxo-4-hydroxy-4-carboxy-5-ureidoimidazoline decarboxylase-like [Saccostrea echinata]|uniref:2-oxo-4-hydroxy-4-carboxy-5-ureidoimidazoline decarboxylase-like n=1 Tax=Saccostrea echinata TaxID=191078 RepID=UPI002A801FA5|nr:2-oxo-4-hydroxy-4-carboxy-5-ureidoimidazoline decarboxylase-like [Saccostrea echinata]
MPSTQIPLKKVNKMTYEEFIRCFGNVVEHCSLCAAAVWRERPFHDVQHIASSFGDFIDRLPTSGKEGILRLHPDLAGRLAQSGQLTSESTREQRSAGLDKMSEEERQRMSVLNKRYKDKFGFPFVICARENKKDAILKGLEERLENSQLTEAITGANEVKKICRLRILDLVNSDSQSTQSSL